MRIAQVIDSLHVGGAEKLQVTFVSAARDAGHHVTIFSLRDNEPGLGALLREAGASVITLPGRGLRDPRRVLWLARLLEQQRVDIVQCHLTYANILGIAAARLVAKAVVGTLHSVALDPQHPGWKHRLEAKMLRHADRVVAVGQSVAQAQQGRLGPVVPVVVPNAVAPMPPLPDTERMQVRASLAIPPGAPLLLSVGRLVEAKGYPDLLEAFAIVRGAHPAARLLIVGAGPEQGVLEEQIARLGLGSAVQLLGSRDDVPDLLAASDLYVNASHWEGLPLAILEAMAAGLPVIATRVGEAPWLLAEKRGCLVAPRAPRELAAAMDDLLATPTRRAMLGSNARCYVERYHSPERWVQQLVALYGEVRLARRRKERPEERRDRAQLVQHYEVERELADRLRHASPEERSVLYGAVYDELFERVPHHPQLRRAEEGAATAAAVERQLRLLARFLPADATFLEVGAGDCALSAEVARRVRKVVAVDVSETITTRHRLPSNLDLCLSDGTSIPVPQGTVDVAYSNQLMEHLHPDDAILQLEQIHRALADGGLYICITPNRLNGPHDISQFFDERASGFHLREYTVSELSELFRRAGFSEVHVYTNGSRLQRRLPLRVMRAVEAGLEALPEGLRRRVVRLKPLRLLLSSVVVGRK